MNFSEFLTLLQDNPNKGITLTLPDDSTAPAHFHITEVGHLTKSFLDCGGKPHRIETCVLQVWTANDYNHRIQAGKLASIVQLASKEFPTTDLPVEFEHEAPVLTQLPIDSCTIENGQLNFHLSYKKTDCLAKDICLPKPDFSLPNIPSKGTNNGSLQTFPSIKK